LDLHEEGYFPYLAFRIRIFDSSVRIGSPISMPDAQIAAICRVSSDGLATRNTKDFANSGLVLINPWKA
jgi:predicted nucleic acid-binding protein